LEYRPKTDLSAKAYQGPLWAEVKVLYLDEAQNKVAKRHLPQRNHAFPGFEVFNKTLVHLRTRQLVLAEKASAVHGQTLGDVVVDLLADADPAMLGNPHKSLTPVWRDRCLNQFLAHEFFLRLIHF
jgi:hypothetical protein